MGILLPLATTTLRADWLVLAGLRPAQVAYYTAVATAIPVLLVAYMLNVNRVVKEGLAPRYLRSENENARRLSTLIVAPFSQGRSIRAAIGYAAPMLWLIAIIVVLLAAAVLPGLGEFEAVRALYVAKSTPLSKALCLVGLLTAGIVVIAPLAWTTVRTVVIAVLFPPARLGWAPGYALVVRWIYRGWRHGQFVAKRWTGREFTYELQTDAGDTSYTATRAIEEITNSAQRMAREGVKIVNAEVLDVGGILVAHEKTRTNDADTDTEEGSAMFFEFDQYKLKRLVRYKDWDHARAKLEPARDVGTT